MKIEFIDYPYIYTDNGKRIKVTDIKGTPRIGAVLDEDFKVIGNSKDQESCVNGVCPTR